MTTQEDIVSEQSAPAVDPFASDAAADPFAAGAPAEAPAETNDETPVTPEGAPEEEIPTVNAEGQRVDTPEAAATAEPEAPAAPEPQPAETGGGQPPQEPPAAPAEVPDPPEAATEPEQAAEPPQEPQEPQEPPAAPAEAAGQPEAVEGDSGAQEQPQANGATPTPATDGGKSPLRHYKLLYQTGDKQWGEYDLTTVSADMKAHTEVVDGEVMLRARNADHARRIAWVIFDRPASGVTVNPVAKSSWNPKRLAPAPPKPERERLSIS